MKRIAAVVTIVFSTRAALAAGPLSLPLEDSDPQLVNGWFYSGQRLPDGSFDGEEHLAIDYRTRLDQPVLAACDGVAIATESWTNAHGVGAYGYFVLHRCDEPSNDPLMVIYAHLDRASPTLQRRSRYDRAYGSWTRVRSGTIIGFSGRSGTSWVHLHFQVFRGNYGGHGDNSVDPYKVYSIARDYPGPCIDTLWRVCPPVPLNEACDLGKNACPSGEWCDFVSGRCNPCVPNEAAAGDACADGFDQDCDGIRDCMDPDCLPTPDCGSWAPGYFDFGWDRPALACLFCRPSGMSAAEFARYRFAVVDPVVFDAYAAELGVSIGTLRTALRAINPAQIVVAYLPSTYIRSEVPPTDLGFPEAYLFHAPSGELLTEWDGLNYMVNFCDPGAATFMATYVADLYASLSTGVYDGIFLDGTLYAVDYYASQASDGIDYDLDPTLFAAPSERRSRRVRA